MHKTEQQCGILQLASTTPWDLFVTLTFTSRRTQEQVTKALKAYFISLERTCFGRQSRYNNINRLPVIEHTAEATHVHIVMEKPDDHKHTHFRDLLLNKWLKIKGAGKANLRKSVEGKSWYEPITNTDEDREKVINYITKHVDRDFSTIDIENIKI